MAAKKDKMIPSEKERKRALKYATPAGTGRMWVTMGIAFIIFGIILLLIPIGRSASCAKGVGRREIILMRQNVRLHHYFSARPLMFERQTNSLEFFCFRL